MAMLVGPQAVLFARGFKGDIDSTVSQYIAYLRSHNHQSVRADSAEDRGDIFAKFRELKVQYDDLRNKVKGGLNELNARVKSIRTELAKLAAGLLRGQAQVSWPDFAWSSWDESIDLMAMLMGLTAGPLGRRDLPEGLEFPPKELQRLMTKDDFYYKVSDYLVNVTSLPANPTPGEAYFYQLAQQAVFCNIILDTAQRGPRFQLERNFYLDKSAQGNKPTALVISRDLSSNIIPGLMHSVSFAYKKLAQFCQHGKGEFERCDACVLENSGKAWTEESQLLRSILVEVSLSNFDRTKLPAEHKNTMDFIYLVTDVEKKQSDSSRLVLLQGWLNGLGINPNDYGALEEAFIAKAKGTAEDGEV